MDIGDTGFYVCSNDVVDVELFAEGMAPVTFVGVGNPAAAGVVGALALRRRVERVAFVDSNPAQLSHMARSLWLIATSVSRSQFLEAFLCVRFGPEARRALHSYSSESPLTLGRSERGDVHVERKVWDGARFDRERFHAETGLRGVLDDSGLLIEASVVGGFADYRVNVLPQPQHGSRWSFSMDFGRSYLASERTFRQMRRFVRSTPISFVLGDLAVALEPVLLRVRYETTALWTSNVLNDWFAGRHPPLSDLRERIFVLGTQRDPALPELDVRVLQDVRTGIELPTMLRPERPDEDRPMGSHTRTFRRVNRWLVGTGVEVVNVSAWVTQDRGTSKFPQLSYALPHDFLSSDIPVKTTFLHILRGHGVGPEGFADILSHAAERSERIVIVEHYAGSSDPDVSELGIEPREVRATLGAENHLEFVAVGDDPRRNLLMVYDQAATRSHRPR